MAKEYTNDRRLKCYNRMFCSPGNLSRDILPWYIGRRQLVKSRNEGVLAVTFRELAREVRRNFVLVVRSGMVELTFDSAKFGGPS
jgi:hypothetical protein